MYVVPSSFTIEMLLNWVGIQGFRAVVDVFQEPQQLKSIISPWQVLTVQSDPEDVEFELSLRLDGLGADNMPGTFGFRCTESWGGTGLWHVDQLVRSQLVGILGGVWISTSGGLASVFCVCRRGTLAQFG